jgi:uncharacterized tellurite resistance protein B-like protein
MRDMVKRFFGKVKGLNSKTVDQKTHHDILVAVCALFVEMARLDETFTPTEMETILSILKEKYGLSQEHAEALIAEAERELKQSVDLWQFSNLINENYSNEEKVEIIETLWRIVYVDGKMDRYEHYLMKKLKNLLRLSHEQLIEAKLKVLHSSWMGSNWGYVTPCMRLVCHQNVSHKKFFRESYDAQGNKVNVEVVDEYGRFVGDLDLYTGDFQYRFKCLECGSPALEVNDFWTIGPV